MCCCMVSMTETDPTLKLLMWWLRRYVEAGYLISQPALAYLLSSQNQMEDWPLPIIISPKSEHSECLPLLWNTKKPPVFVQRHLKVNAKGEQTTDKRKSDAASPRGKAKIQANRKKSKKNNGVEPSTGVSEQPDGM